MSCKIHSDHPHVHGPDCGHAAVAHDDHVDYLHNGYLHHPHGDHVDEHVLNVDSTNPAQCTPDHTCNGHDAEHVHGPDCGHPAIPPGDHVDYLVDGHFYDHGPVSVT